MNGLIEVSSLSYSYDEEKYALKNINLNIYKSEKIALIGANGAGKTTFFLTLNGIIRPGAGSIKINGKIMDYSKNALIDLRKKTGIVFQEPEIQIIGPTVFKEVSFGPMNLGLPKEAVFEKTNNALSYMEIEHLSDRSPQYLSGGEKRRVTIADVIAMEPELILFDEPTANMDCKGIENFEDILHSLHHDGITLLVSTHDLDFAYKWADRILVFHEGEIIGDGVPSDIFTDKALLEKAAIRKPLVLEMAEILIEKGVLKKGTEYPRTIHELKGGIS